MSLPPAIPAPGAWSMLWCLMAGNRLVLVYRAVLLESEDIARMKCFGAGMQLRCS